MTTTSKAAMEAAKEILDKRGNLSDALELGQIIVILEKHYESTLTAFKELLDSLEHMQICRPCSEGSWSDCEGGQKALTALANAQKILDEGK